MRGELHALKSKTFVKDYFVDKVLLRGQDTIVYIAEDMKQGRKFLLTEFTPRVIVMRGEGEESLTILNKKRFEDIKQQFVNDIIRFNQTTNINLMKTLRSFETNGTVYSVTEYREEKPFQEYIANKQFSEIDVIMLFMPLFSTLTSLHHKGEVFKHLSLSNLFVNKQGSLYLSQVANAYPSIYHHYSPIEQYKRNEHLLSVESDIYALAALMYEVMEGNPPVDSNIREKALQRGETDPFKPLIQVNQRSKVFCDFVNQALSLASENRPSSLSPLQAMVKTKPEVTQKELPNPLKVKKKESLSLLRMAGIMLISVIAYGLIIEYSAATVSLNEISKVDVMRYQWAAFLGDDKAQNALGTLYEQGIQVEHNPKKAMEWYKKAAEQGNTNAIDRLSQIKSGVKNTPLTTQNTTSRLSRKQYQELRNQRNLAYYYYESEKNYAKAFELYNKIVELDQNDAYAMMFIGYLYRNGKGVKKDYIKANQWLQKATQMGDKYAPYYLGNSYNDGDGVKRDLQKAFSLYKLSAERGFDCAMVQVGKMYYKGVHSKDILIKKDLKIAKSWFVKANGKGNAIAKKYVEKIDRINDPAEIRRKREERIKIEMQNATSKNVYYYPDKKPVDYGRFLDYGSYIKDTTTGLLWQKNGQASGKLNFYQAKKYAEGLTLGGLHHWRVPTSNELRGIFPALAKPFTNTPSLSQRAGYWTSELDRRMDDYAYLYQWYTYSGRPKGGANNCYASKNYVYVRAVHDPID